MPLPTLPQVQVDTTMPTQTGTTISCANTAAFTSALGTAQLGDIIELQEGITFAGPFTLPNKTTGSGWIVIRSRAYASLPPEGTRVGTGDAANMATITGTASGSAIITAQTAHHFRFVGIRFIPVSGDFINPALIRIGDGTGQLSTVRHHMVFDRCLVLADPTGGRRGFWINGDHMAIIDCYIAGWREVGADSQAILVTNGGSGYKFVNNYIEGAAENILFGGVDPLITDDIPSDITFQRNYCFKPLAWKADTTLTVKNLFELKNARRVLIEGNIFENNWDQGQDGTAILFTVRNQENTAPWSTVDDITFRHNIVRHSGSGFNILGRDDINTSAIMNRVHIHNNLITDIDPTTWGGGGRLFHSNGAPIDVVVEHNTTFSTGPIMLEESGIDRFIFRNNICRHGAGFLGAGTGVGNDTLDYWYPDEIFTHNVLFDDSASIYSYPANTYLLDDPASVGFVDLNGENYRLTGASTYHNAATDGTDIGADFDALDAAQAGVTLSDPLRTPDVLRVLIRV